MTFDISQLVIERNVPIPPPYNPSHRPSIVSVVRKLEVGECVVVPKKQSSISSSLHRLPGKFTTRQVTPESTRVWRVA